VFQRSSAKTVGGTDELLKACETERFDLTIPEKNISGPLFFPQLEYSVNTLTVFLSAFYVEVILHVHSN